MAQPVSVSQLNHYIKDVIENDILLNRIIVTGEISNVKHYKAGGQIYFTLKDDASQISCVLFSSVLAKLKIQPTDGLTAILHGRITLYEKRGQYSLQVFFLEPQGIGALASAFEQLKEKLAQEGLFSPERKKTLPEWPEHIGVIAAEHGAAIHDVESVIHRRCPLTQVMRFPAVVQGALAPDSIVEQLHRAAQLPEIEVIILARGGGSLEDLWAFNEERVARAIAVCNVPVVSAVGHEIDFTIADFVADLRAPTPSAAAELVVPDLFQTLTTFRNRLHSGLQHQYQTALQRVGFLKEKLEAFNPHRVLQRGYSITRKNGKIIKDVSEVKSADEIETLLTNGRFTSKVYNKKQT